MPNRSKLNFGLRRVTEESLFLCKENENKNPRQFAQRLINKYSKY